MMIKKGLWIGLLVGASAFASVDQTQKVVDVKSVQQWIARTKAGWTAKETWVSKLSRQDIQRMFGLIEKPSGRLIFDSIKTKRVPPIDWRNKDGVNWLGPILNQGNCGSCVAFASVATLEGQVSISSGFPMMRPSFSPQALFACGGGACDRGWYPSSAASYLKRTGVPDEACMPYTSGSTGEDVACNITCADSDARMFKISGYNQPSGGWFSNAEKVKQALQKGPLMTTMTVYADFVAYGSGIYKTNGRDELGGHAISLVGFDDTARAWIIRNSWGAEWGENGYARISYDDTSGIGSETWAFTVPSQNEFINVQSPSDNEYVSGSYKLRAAYNGNFWGGSNFTIRDENGKVVENVACESDRISGCSGAIDTSKFRDGRYEIFAAGSSNSKQLNSQFRAFWVINSEPKLSLSYTPIDADLSAPIKGRLEFNVDATFSPVPMTKVEFVVRKLDGTTASVKGNEAVLEHMKMGWRSNSVPNGTYEIFFRGETPYAGKLYTTETTPVQIRVEN